MILVYAMKGLVRAGLKHQFQAAIPADVRDHFDGKKKFSRMIHTGDVREAERLAADADREFQSKVLQIRQAKLNGERIDPLRLQQVTGYLFGQFYNQPQDDRFFDLEQSIHGVIVEGHEDGFPLLRDVPTEGPVFDELVRGVETLLEYAEATGYARNKKVERPGSTMNSAATIWAPKAKHTAKTKDQYLKDVRDFTTWFELRRGPCYGAKVSKRDVNDYVSYLMSKEAAKATIMRSLAALRLIYKAGQFSVENPFSRVTDRMVIEGDKLAVRKFTDQEVIRLLKLKTDPNVHMAMLIAAYSGMRLSEITSLKIEHIERAGPGRVFNLMNAGRRKTKASYRKVPVHPKVWKELGPFIKGRDAAEYILAGEPENKYGSRSAALSQRINRSIDVITTDETAREHGFRHTLISKLAEAGVRREWRMAIVGHEGDDVHDQYTHMDFISQLLTEIAKVEYRAG